MNPRLKFVLVGTALNAIACGVLLWLSALGRSPYAFLFLAIMEWNLDLHGRARSHVK